MLFKPDTRNLPYPDLRAFPFLFYVAFRDDTTAVGNTGLWCFVHFVIYFLAGWLFSVGLNFFMHSDMLAILFATLLILGLNWFSPTSQAAGAGNMVVNAIRQEIPLELEPVKSMSCFSATPNNSIMLMIILSSAYIASMFKPLGPWNLLILVALALFYHPMNQFFQRFTCRRPSDAQLNEVLETGRQYLSEKIRIANRQRLLQ
jgi:hypothetical protein